MFPHHGGGGGNARNVLKSAGRKPFHCLVLIITVVNQIYEARGDQVGKMADGSHDKIMLPVVQHERNGSDGFCNPCHAFREGRRSLSRRRDNIVGILQEVVGGILIAGLFGTGHRMAAYEAVLHPERCYRLMDIRFGASHIGNDSPLFDKRFDLLQIIGIIFHGGAEENDITFRQVFVDTVQNYIHNPIPLCLFQLLSGAHVRHNPGARRSTL